MPRIKPKTNPRVQWMGRETLTKGTRNDLIEIIGLNPDDDDDQRKAADQVVAQVEQVLGFYTPLQSSLDHGPRAAHHLKTLARLRSPSNALEAELFVLDGDLKALYHYAGVDIELLGQQLDLLLSVTHWIQSLLEGRGSRHAPRKVARLIVATRLACIFLSFRPPLPDAKGRADSPDMELKDFVRVALKAIDVPSLSHQHWAGILKAAKAYHATMKR